MNALLRAKALVGILPPNMKSNGKVSNENGLSREVGMGKTTAQLSHGRSWFAFHISAFAVAVLLTAPASPADGRAPSSDYERARRAARYVEKGRELHKVGDLAGALMDFNEAIRIDSDYPDAYMQRGLVKADRGDVDGAIDDFNRTLERSPDHVQAFYQRAIANEKKDDFEGAIADLTKVIQESPEFPEAYFRRAQLQFELKHYDEAIGDYTSVLELDKSQLSALVSRGRAQSRKGDLEAALEDLTRAIREDETYSAAYHYRGGIKILLGQIDKALLDYNRAIKHAPDQPDGYLTRGFTYLSLGRLDHSVSDLGKALNDTDEAQAKDYANLWMWLILSNQGQGDLASRQLRDYLASRANDIEEDDGWYLKLAGFFLGDLEEDALLAAIPAENEETAVERECEAYFYAAQLRFLEGDSEAGRNFLHRCVETGVDYFYEYLGAIAQLKENRG